MNMRYAIVPEVRSRVYALPERMRMFRRSLVVTSVCVQKSTDDVGSGR